jgi:hypothetical protein
MNHHENKAKGRPITAREWMWLREPNARHKTWHVRACLALELERTLLCINMKLSSGFEHERTDVRADTNPNGKWQGHRNQFGG